MGKRRLRGERDKKEKRMRIGPEEEGKKGETEREELEKEETAGGRR